MSETLQCRACGAPLRLSVIDLGSTPLANSYVEPADLATRDAIYPLHARLCEACFLVQVEDAVPPEEIFTEYAYFSSYSPSWVEQCKRYCEAAQRRFGLGPGTLAVEVASNDGYLLQHFVAMGVPVLGVEPARNVAQVARERGVPTESVFFGRDSATELVARHGHARLMAANNVLAHVPDINDFLGGFAIMLAEDGVASFEFPHLLRLLDEVQFDTIYHEHYSYLSLFAVERILAGQGLRAFDVEELPSHGGSLRLWVCKTESERAEEGGLHRLRAKEEQGGIAELATYEGMQPKVEAIRRDLLAFLSWAKGQGKTVAAYGAAAKGNTLLNFCGVTAQDIDFVVDANPRKQGRFLPGSRVPILAPEALRARKPDYVLILPWNLADEIRGQADFIREWGGRFLVAIPSMTVF